MDVELVVAKELSSWMDFWLGGYFTVVGASDIDRVFDYNLQRQLMVRDPEHDSYGSIVMRLVFGDGCIVVHTPWSGTVLKGAVGKGVRVDSGEAVFELARPESLDELYLFLFDTAIGYARMALGRGGAKGMVRYYRAMAGIIEENFRRAWVGKRGGRS